MTNKYRYLDILLFYAKDNFFINDREIKKGWNQLIRKENNYFVKSITESIFYIDFPVKNGYKLIEKIFGSVYN